MATRNPEDGPTAAEIMSQQLSEERAAIVSGQNIYGVAFSSLVILDSPPVSPEITILPHRDDSTKIKILFQQATDKVVLPYVWLTEAERRGFESIRTSQLSAKCDLLCAPSTVQFKSEGNDIEGWEVFRTTNIPRGLFETVKSSCEEDEEGCFVRQSFAGDYRKAFNATPYQTIYASAASSFIDDIEPNKKYFYMFRTMDRHNHISNPTKVFQIEMVKDGGMFFPIIKIYDPVANHPIIERSFRELIDIRLPTMSAEPHWEDGNWEVGNKETAYGQRFKIRITSKDTGRIIEVNVKPTSTSLIADDN